MDVGQDRPQHHYGWFVYDVFHRVRQGFLSQFVPLCLGLRSKSRKADE